MMISLLGVAVMSAGGFWEPVLLLEGWFHGAVLRVCELSTDNVCTHVCQQRP